MKKLLNIYRLIEELREMGLVWGDEELFIDDPQDNVRAHILHLKIQEALATYIRSIREVGNFQC